MKIVNGRVTPSEAELEGFRRSAAVALALTQRPSPASPVGQELSAARKLLPVPPAVDLRPCHECHLNPGEVCDICGAKEAN